MNNDPNQQSFNPYTQPSIPVPQAPTTPPSVVPIQPVPAVGKSFLPYIIIGLVIVVLLAVGLFLLVFMTMK